MGNDCGKLEKKRAELTLLTRGEVQENPNNYYEFLREVESEDEIFTQYVVQHRRNRQKFMAVVYLKSTFVKEEITSLKRTNKLLMKLNVTYLVPIIEVFDYGSYLCLIKEPYKPQNQVVKMRYASRQDAQAYSKQILISLLQCFLQFQLNNLDFFTFRFHRLLYFQSNRCLIKLAEIQLANDHSRLYFQPLSQLRSVPPQVLKGQYYSNSVIYTIGLFIVTIVNGKHPLDNLNDRKQIESAIRQGVNSDWLQELSREGREMLSSMLNLDHQARPSIEECLQMAWLKQPKSSEIIKSNVREAIQTLIKFKLQLKIQVPFIKYVLLKAFNKHNQYRLRQVFLALDRNKTSRVTIKNIVFALSQMGFTRERAKLIAKAAFDQLGAGSSITFLEFYIATLDRSSKQWLKSVDQGYMFALRHNEDTISVQSLHILIEPVLSEDQYFDQMLQQAGLQGDIDIQIWRRLLVEN